MNSRTAAESVAPTPGVESKNELAVLLDEPAARPWYLRATLWAGVAGLAIAAVALWWWQQRQAADAAPSYTTQAAVRGNLTLTVTANGTLQPTRSISIGSELSGTVAKVNVDVKKKKSP